MALLITYNGTENCYLKAVPTTISEYFIDEIKYFNTYLIYSISENGEIIFRDGFEILINPDEPIFEQVYDRMKELFPESESV